MTSKFALVIANTEYQDTSFAQLSAPGKDADEFAQVLRDLAGFDGVQVLLNEGEGKTRRSIARFFADRKHDDLLLLYFSGHGVRDEQGQLFLAASDTEISILDASGVPADFITAAMNSSRSQRQLLILDCCNSGAFAQGSKAATGVGKSMGIATAFEGSGFGRVVLTATDATQYAWEGDKVTGYTQKSLFTHFLIEGLKGDADQNGDGCIDVDELFDYVYDQVIRTTPKQTPGKWSYKQQGDIILRDNLTPREVKPMPLPAEVLELLSHPSSGVRKAGVQDLIALMQGSHPGLARAAEEKLREISEKDDSLTIRRTARDELMARGVVLDKDTTEKFLKENMEAKAKEAGYQEQSTPSSKAEDHAASMQKTVPIPNAAHDSSRGRSSKIPPRLIVWIAGGLLVLILIIAAELFMPPVFGPAAETSTSKQDSAQPMILAFTNTSFSTFQVTKASSTSTSRPATRTPKAPPPTLLSETQTSTASVLAAPTTAPIKQGIDGMTLLLIPAEKFEMGHDNGLSYEGPAHEVSLDAYWIDQTEVTNAMYASCVKAGACIPPNPESSKTHAKYYGNPEFDNFPVIYVPWESANAYCTWAGRRLPTEAEWERAARGTDGRDYPWGNEQPNYDWLNYAVHVGDTTQAGSYPLGQSPSGALDMAGNVSEWVADWYSNSYYSVSPSSNPGGPDTGAYRVVRGGSWVDGVNKVRTTYRTRYIPWNSHEYLGFRCALDVSP